MEQQTEVTETVLPFNRGKTQDDSTITMSVIMKNLKQLSDLYIIKQGATENYATSTKAVAEKAGVIPSVLRNLVKAVATGEFDKHKAQAQQLSLVFEEMVGS